MDTIHQIISTFDEEDVVSFRRFLKRTKGNEDRKDLQLFNLFIAKGEESSKEFSALLYPEGNNASYQAVRKRLTKLLTRFIALKLLDNDSSEASMVLSLVNMARYLFSHNLSSLGWKYLLKAEKAALKNDLFEILNSIYVLQIQYLQAESGTSYETLIKKWKANKKRLEINEQGEIALSLVTDKIKQAQQSGEFEDIDKLIKNALKDLNLNENYLLQPRFVYNVASMNRRRMLLDKDYFNLEPFIIKQFELINGQVGFQKKHNYYKLGFLYMISHTLYRNKKFDLSLEYLAQLETELKHAAKSQKNEFFSRVILLRANLLLFNSNIDESIRLLSDLLKAKSVIVSQKDRLNAIVNLGVFHYYKGDFRQTRKVLNDINHSDKWCEKIMGREWVMKKNIMEVILYIELEEFSLVDSRIRYLHRSFRDILHLDKYRRVATYIKFLRKIANSTLTINELSLEEEVEDSFEWIPFETEDIQAIAFYAWLKSKIQKRGNYEVLLELIQANQVIQ
ncbi:MAG: hypothetical protein CL840_12940 [Crocinitomicaceae bacterium]|nr:hypothetical protein [Crocinitomicaceae bacterium]|tara:strand:- start:827 stop:2350 length:1524 start_codon:yes stop_codon:yes gene_type:complete